MRNLTVGFAVSLIVAACGGGGGSSTSSTSTNNTPSSPTSVAKDPLRIVTGISYDADDQGYNPRWVVADLNKDGIKDIVLRYDPESAFSNTSTGTSPVRFFMGINNGGFEQSTNIFPKGYSPTIVNRMVAEDYNGDGGVDIFIATSGQDPYVNGKPSNTGVSGAQVQLLSYSPNGYKLATIDNSPVTFSHHASSGDITGDYLPDILVNSLVYAEPFFVLGNNNGTYKVDVSRFPKNTFKYQNQIISRFNNGNPQKWTNTNYTASVIVDANNDTHADVVMLAASGTKSSLIYFNDGSGNFSNLNSKNLPVGPYGEGYQYVDDSNNRYSVGTIYLDAIAVDLNKDGKKDIITISTESNQSEKEYVFYRGAALQILMNTGNGFTDESSTRSNFKYTPKNNYTHYDTIEYMDINRDNCNDILLHRAQVNNGDSATPTRILLNDCKGNFTEKSYPKNLPIGILTVIGDGHYAVLVSTKINGKYTQRIDDIFYDWTLGQNLFP